MNTNPLPELTYKQVIEREAKKAALKAADDFDLLKCLNLTEEAGEMKISISGTNEFGRHHRITIDLDQLNNELKDFIVEQLPEALSLQLLEKFLNSPSVGL